MFSVNKLDIARDTNTTGRQYNRINAVEKQTLYTAKKIEAIVGVNHNIQSLYTCIYK